MEPKAQRFKSPAADVAASDVALNTAAGQAPGDAGGPPLLSEASSG